MCPDEFEQYMAGEIVSTSTWECALVICEVNALESSYTVKFSVLRISSKILIYKRK